MAGTITGNEAVGAADWSGWIAATNDLRTGFQRISLTNFSGTAASSIAAGSFLEVAGSFYTFTETAITLADDTPSAAQAVYYTAIPSAGGTTLSIVMEGTAPTWVDGKQGFYASAASLTRYIGGCYIGTAETYYNKFLYTGENLLYCLQTGKTRPLLKKILELGEWNMDATYYVEITHGMIHDKIRTFDAFVRNDDNTKINSIRWDTGSGASGRIGEYNTLFQVARLSAGTFDSADYNGTASSVANRGWVFIEYEA